ncbi:MAG: hypothetical protein ACJA0U_001149 [Salibacteraceae bacterium]|jgi:hypothetical protein
MRHLLFGLLLLATQSFTFGHQTDSLVLEISKTKSNGTQKVFIIEYNDFLKIKLKNGTTTKGRISKITESSIVVDSTEVQFSGIKDLGMNYATRRKFGQYASAWILGIGATAAITGIILIFGDDFDTGIGLSAMAAVSGLISTYTLDLAYGNRKKFHLTDSDWSIKTRTKTFSAESVDL